MTLPRCIKSSFVLLVSLLLVSILPAQQPSAGDEAIQQLAWAVGGKWVAELKGAEGQPLTVETTFQWAGHRKSINYAVLFKSADKSISQYEGTFWWNPEKKHLSLLQIDRQGNVTEAVLTVKGDEFKQENTVLKADGTRQNVRAEFVRQGEDTFAFKAFVMKDNEWVEAVAITYKRVR